MILKQADVCCHHFPAMRHPHPYLALAADTVGRWDRDGVDAQSSDRTSMNVLFSLKLIIRRAIVLFVS